MELKPWLIVFVSTLLLVSCAAFSYRYYGLAQVDYQQGMLLGPTDRDDLPFSKCAPNQASRNPCVVMFTKDFFAFKQDYEDVKMRLAECEKH